MLDEAVAEALRAGDGGARRGAAEPVRLDVDVDAYVPADYVPFEAAKIDVHRRIAAAREPGELRALRDELEDRFGPLPEPVENLLDAAAGADRARRARARAASSSAAAGSRSSPVELDSDARRGAARARPRGDLRVGASGPLAVRVPDEPERASRRADAASPTGCSARTGGRGPPPRPSGLSADLGGPRLCCRLCEPRIPLRSGTSPMHLGAALAADGRDRRRRRRRRRDPSVPSRSTSPSIDDAGIRRRRGLVAGRRTISQDGLRHAVARLQTAPGQKQPASRSPQAQRSAVRAAQAAGDADRCSRSRWIVGEADRAGRSSVTDTRGPAVARSRSRSAVQDREGVREVPRDQSGLTEADVAPAGQARS